MDWFREVNIYCERTDAAYWSEPINAVTNAAFLIAAALCWRMLGDRRDLGARSLTLILAAIGVGSFLFHTHAQVWAGAADVAPIQLFILVYLYLATVRFFGASAWAGAIAVVMFIPYAWAAQTAVEAVVGRLNGSAAYAPVPLLIGAYALALARRSPRAARDLAIGAGLLVVSLTFRTIDEAVCPALPLGTHFLWHMLNAVMLAWMIRTLPPAPSRP